MRLVMLKIAQNQILKHFKSTRTKGKRSYATTLKSILIYTIFLLFLSLLPQSTCLSKHAALVPTSLRNILPFIYVRWSHPFLRNLSRISLLASCKMLFQ